MGEKPRLYRWWAEMRLNGKVHKASGFTKDDVQRKLDAIAGEPVEINWREPLRTQEKESDNGG